MMKLSKAIALGLSVALTASGAVTVFAEETKDFSGKTLTLLLSTGDSNAVEAYYAQIEAFEEKYGCTVEAESSPGGDEGENLRLVRLATGSLADVYQTNIGAKFDEMDPVNNCLDLSGEEWIGNVAEGYRNTVTYGEGIYAVPADTSNAAGVLYNTKVFEKLNIEIPETWDEFLSVCETIKESGVDPIAAPYAKITNSQIPFLMNYFYVQQESPTFAEDYIERKVDLDDSEAYLRGLQKLADMVPYLNEDALSLGMDECAVMLGEGSAAMMVIRTNILTTMEANCPEYIEDIDFFPLPDKEAENRGISYWMPMGWTVNKNAKEPELAKAWCEFVSSQDGVNAYSSAVTPMGTFCLNNVSLDGIDMPRALTTAQKWIDKASSPVMEYFCKIKGSNQATICSMVATGEITPEEGLEQIMEDNAIDAQSKGFENW